MMEGSGYGKSKHTLLATLNEKSGSLRRQRPGILQESVTYNILSEHRYLRKVSKSGLQLVSLVDDVFRGDVQDVHLSVLHRLEHL